MRHRRTMIAACLLLAGVATLASADQPAASLLLRTALAPDQRHVMVVGHRGGGFFAPENTLAAIALGIEVGVDGVEIDVRKTADGHYILMHDDTVDRTTNGTGDVAFLDLARIREFEIRWTPPQYARKSQFPAPPDSERFRHLRVPTLEEALEEARGKAFVMLDSAPQDADGIARLVAQQGMIGEVIFKVSSAAEGEAVRAVAPEAVLMGRPDDAAQLDELLTALHPPIMHLDSATFTDEAIERLDDAGVLIWMNTLGKDDAVALVADADGLRWTERLGPELASVLQVTFEPHVRVYRGLAQRGADFIQTDNLVTVVKAMGELKKPLRRAH